VGVVQGFGGWFGCAIEVCAIARDCATSGAQLQRCPIASALRTALRNATFAIAPYCAGDAMAMRLALFGHLGRLRNSWANGANFLAQRISSGFGCHCI
jgi:hypothetical protein